MTTTYKVGDKVRARNDFGKRLMYGGLYATERIAQLAGSINEITEVKVVCSGEYEVVVYHLSGDKYNFEWTSKMLEKYEEPVKEMKKELTELVEDAAEKCW